MTPAEGAGERPVQLLRLITELGEIERLIHALDPEPRTVGADDSDPPAPEPVGPGIYNALKDLRQRRIEVRDAIQALMIRAVDPPET